MKRFQISEGDLAVLERIGPILSQCVSLSPTYNEPEVTVALEELQRIASDVRWDYGPHRQVTRHDLDDVVDP